jgi:hypothetical protein
MKRFALAFLMLAGCAATAQPAPATTTTYSEPPPEPASEPAASSCDEACYEGCEIEGWEAGAPDDEIAEVCSVECC